MELRDYQKECVQAMRDFEGMSALLVIATGLGKTAVFCEYTRREVLENDHTVLILSHRDELVHNPLRYLPGMRVGVELGKEHSNGESIISASVQSLVGRLKRFNPRSIDTIIIDEAHHAAATTYRKILDYFESAQIFGFTATAHRGDGIGLECVFEKIIFERDVRWGILNGFLCDIECRQIRLKYKMESVRIENMDFAAGDIEQALSGTAAGVAEIYDKYARGQTIIFAASINEAEQITGIINRKHGDIARKIDATTPNRKNILYEFERGRYKVLVNFAVLTEGIDTQNAETILIARPIALSNVGLYAQMVGRGLRPYPGKDKCLVLDCVGISHSPLCTAATLLGAETPDDKPDMDAVLAPRPDDPLIILRGGEIPQTWVRAEENVNIWALGQGVYTHGIAWFPLQDGGMVLSFPGVKFSLDASDENNQTYLWKDGKRAKSKVSTQKALDYVYLYCMKHHEDKRYLWDAEQAKRWGDGRMSNAQFELIRKLAPDYRIGKSGLTRGDASAFIKTLLYDTTRKGT